MNTPPSSTQVASASVAIITCNKVAPSTHSVWYSILFCRAVDRSEATLTLSRATKSLLCSSVRMNIKRKILLPSNWLNWRRPCSVTSMSSCGWHQNKDCVRHAHTEHFVYNLIYLAWCPVSTFLMITTEIVFVRSPQTAVWQGGRSRAHLGTAPSWWSCDSHGRGFLTFPPRRRSSPSPLSAARQTLLSHKDTDLLNISLKLTKHLQIFGGYIFKTHDTQYSYRENMFFVSCLFFTILTMLDKYT